MKKRIFTILIAIFTTCATVLLAQERDLFYNHLSEKDGLPSNRILCMTKDSIGFLWFGTSLGLVRYDGMDMDVFNSGSGISDIILTDEIVQLETHRSGKLIALTKKGFLLFYDYNLQVKNSLKHAGIVNQSGELVKIRRFITTDKEIIWLISDDGHMYKYNLTNHTYKIVNRNPYLKNILTCYKDKHNCWIGTEQGLVSFDMKNELVQPVPLNTSSPGIPVNASIGGIVPFGKDSLMLSCNKDLKFMFDGLLMYDKITGKTAFFEIGSTDFCSSDYWFDDISYLGNNEYYLKGEDNNAVYFNKKTKKVNKIDIQKGVIGKIHTVSLKNAYRHDNLIYILSNQGIYIHDPKSQLFTEYYPYKIRRPRGLSGSYLIKNTGQLLIGGNRNVRIYDIEKDSTLRQIPYPCIKMHHSKLGESNIIHVENDTFLIITSHPFLLDLSDQKMTLLEDLTYEVCTESSFFPYCIKNKTIYFSNDGYLYKFSLSTFKISKVILKDKNASALCLDITGLVFDPHDRMWITTKNTGLWLVNKVENGFAEKFQFFENQKNIPWSDIEVDNNNVLWLTSSGHGLFRCAYNQKNNKLIYSKFQVKDGFKTSELHQLIGDNYHNLWITTSYGISKFDKKNSIIHNFGKIHGINYPHNLFRGKAKDTEGNIYFSGGINILKMSNPALPQNPNKVVVKKLSIFNGEDLVLNKDTALTLNSDQNAFSVEFASLSFSFPERNLYRYRLTGVQDKWIYTNAKKRIASFTNLASGYYNFLVQSSNSEGVWNEKTLSIAIRVLAPWYQTWWFRSIVFLVLAYSSWWMIKFRTNRLLEKQKTIIEKELAIDAERKRIARDMHDDLGSGLSAIHLYSDYLRNNLAEKYPEIADDIQKIVLSSSDLNQKVKEIIWANESKMQSVATVFQFLKKSYTEIINSSRLNLKIEDISKEKDHPLDAITSKNVYLCLKEAINNSIKYAGAKNITVGFDIGKNKNYFIVQDDGTGFNVSDKINNGGRGLRNIMNRMKEMNGSAEINSSPYGTTIKLYLPL